MKTKKFFFLLSFIIAFASCGHSPKTMEAKTSANDNTADTSLHIIATSDHTALPDTQPLHVQQIEEGKKYLRNNWMNLIHVNKGDYKTGKNNKGIFKDTLGIENTTAYPIDSIKILITYYAHGECVKSEYIKSRVIPAEGKITLKVPDNPEATSFQTQVRKVNSSAMQFCFDIDDPNREGDDPYKCK